MSLWASCAKSCGIVGASNEYFLGKKPRNDWVA
jgi:hypothetical protein